jgi:hypothetical protein
MASNLPGDLPDGIASLRWVVQLYMRTQVPAASGGLSESLVLIASTHGDVQPSWASTFNDSKAIDQPISHIICTRWVDYIENTSVIFRSTLRPADNTFRTELFRVRRVKEVGGRKRFSAIECELEASKTTPDDSEASRIALFMENPTP